MNKTIAFLPAGNDGVALYRQFLPHLRTPNSKYVQANAQGLVQYSDFADCQIGVVQRLASEKNLETIQEMKKLGMSIVFDLDDDMWSVQSSNPAKSHFRIFKDYERGFMTCATSCNHITVSTNKLKKVVEFNIGKSIPTTVVPNAVDLSLLQPSILPRKDKRVVIGWGGSNTHLVDLTQMGKALDIVVDENPDVYLHWVGMLPPGQHLAYHERVIAHTWAPPREYFARLSTWNWTIGVAPLEDNRFNKSKSAIKMVEMGALKKPCLASPIQPYLEVTSLDDRLKWLLCESEKDWVEKLTILARSEEKRNYYGELLYQVVKKYYNMEIRAKVWQEVFRSLA